jgi:hypothetical protein
MRRILTVVAALGMIAVAAPSAAQAAKLSNYRVTDLGSEIRHRVTVCLGRSAKVHFISRIERDDGSDYNSYDSWTRLQRGCTRVSLYDPDELRYEDWYYARLRVASTSWGYVYRTPWRRFWSS